MDARLAKLEGAVDSFKLLFTVIIAVMLGGFAFLGVQLTRVDSKVSSLTGDVQALPGKISGSLTDLTRTLSDAITAARQAPTQVILVPSPTGRPEQPSAAPSPQRNSN